MQEFLTRIKPKQRKYFNDLRSALLSLPETEESLDIDDIEGEWCPAYRVNGSDLVWVHFDERMWLSVPVERRFEKKALQDENLDSDVVDRIRDAEETGNVKWARIEIESGDQVEQVVPLLKLRHSLLVQMPEAASEPEEEEIAVEEKVDFEETLIEPKDEEATSALTDATEAGPTKPRTRKR
jgi:hypothetical protein